MAAVTPSSDAGVGVSSQNADEFGFETKAVVLNFMGMLPTPTPTNTTSSSSSSGSGGGRHLSTQHSHSSVESHSASWKKKELPDLPEMSIMERFDPSQSEDELDIPVALADSPTKTLKRQSAHDISHASGGHGNRHQHTYRQSLSVGEDYPPLQSYMQKTSPKRQLVKWKTVDAAQSPPHAPEAAKHAARRLKKSDRPDSLPLEAQSGSQGHTDSPSPKRSPRPSSQSSQIVPQCRETIDRQHSSSSGSSEESLSYSDNSSLYMSGRSLTSASSTYVSVQTADVDSLVKAKTLPAVAVPLRDEICKELLDLERERVERGLSTTPHESFDGSQASHGASFLPPLSMPSVSMTSQLHSPETQVADYLRIIGDRVNADYGAEIDQVVAGLQERPREQITYEVLRCLAVQLLQHMGVSHSNGWHKVSAVSPVHFSTLSLQVALVLLLGQRVTLSLLQRGERGISTLVEYVTRLVMDQAAEFVISRGGWVSEHIEPNLYSLFFAAHYLRDNDANECY